MRKLLIIAALALFLVGCGRYKTTSQTGEDLKGLRPDIEELQPIGLYEFVAKMEDGSIWYFYMKSQPESEENPVIREERKLF